MNQTQRASDTLPRAVPATLGAREFQTEKAILLVEDNDLVRNNTAEILKSERYRVVTATNASEAASMFHGHSPISLLITDVVLPGKRNGRELAENLRSLCSDLPAILISGYPENEATGETVQGMRFLPKPYAIEELLRTVEKALT